MADVTMFELLDSFGLPWYRQGSAPHELPPVFLTEWEFDRDLFLKYDDDAAGEYGVFSICLYTSDPARLDDLSTFCKYAKNAGFILRILPRDVASGIEGYYGRQCEIYDVKLNKQAGDGSPKE